MGTRTFLFRSKNSTALCTRQDFSMRIDPQTRKTTTFFCLGTPMRSLQILPWLQGLLLLLIFAGTAQANAPMDLEQIMTQISEMRQQYDRRIARLEQQRGEDQKRIQALEVQLQTQATKTSMAPAPEVKAPGNDQSASTIGPGGPAVGTGVSLQPGIATESTDLAEPETAVIPYPLPVADKTAPKDKSPLSLDGSGSTILDHPDGPLPFSLRANISVEGRYSYFGRTRNYWVPNNSGPQGIHDYSVIELNRAMLSFSGYALRPELNYNVILYGSTAAGSLLPLGFVGYDFDPALKARVGAWKAPGTREWTASWATTLGADRTMATTYFRPNWTPGAWIQGHLHPTLDYQLFVGNSFGGAATNYEANRPGTGMLYAYSTTWEPLGAMGANISDLKQHEHPAIRLGSTGVYQSTIDSAANPGTNNPDSTIFRLSNGTPFSGPNALGVGTTVQSADVYLATLDAALKYQGFALYAEFMYRHLNNFGYAGPAPTVQSLNDFGGILQGSYFLMPGTLEMFARSSLIDGQYGTPWEAGGGLNWYPMAMVPNWIVTAESLYINHSAASNLLTPYRAGETGVVGQMEVKFLF